jgi:hypothetical protein
MIPEEVSFGLGTFHPSLLKSFSSPCPLGREKPPVSRSKEPRVLMRFSGLIPSVSGKIGDD